MTRLLPLAALLVAAAPAAAGERAPRPRLCPQDAPPGVRLPDRPECREAEARGVRAAERPAPGFIDLGSGMQVRIGGRAAFEAGTR